MHLDESVREGRRGERGDVHRWRIRGIGRVRTLRILSVPIDDTASVHSEKRRRDRETDNDESWNDGPLAVPS